MIIPIRCFTCGKVLADKYDYYVQQAERLAREQADEGKKAPDHFDGPMTGKLLDDLGLTRYCCRRHMLTTVDMMGVIS